MRRIIAVDKRKLALRGLLVFLLIVLALFLFSQPLIRLVSNAQQLRTFIEGYGILAPVVFIFLHVLQVIVAPIPGQPGAVAGGFLFGVGEGLLYTVIGNVLGSLIIFLLARRFGRPFVERVLHKQTLKRFDYVCKDKGGFALFLLFLLPALPNDAICFLAGLTPLRIRTLVLLTLFGRLPGLFILNLVGHGFAVQKELVSSITFAVALVVSLVVYRYRDRIERCIRRFT